MTCRCSGPCNCGCSPPTTSSSSDPNAPTNPNGTPCTDPGILDRGIPVIVDEDFCTRRTRMWRGLDPSGNPITDPVAPAVAGFFVQGSDGLAGFSSQPCVEFPELEAYTYGSFVDSIMGRKDGCEFDVVGKAGEPSVLFWDGSKLLFVDPADIDLGGQDCATLGSQLVLDAAIFTYTATISDGMDKLGKDLSVNVGGQQMVVSEILSQAAGLIKLDLIDPIYGDPVTIPVGTPVCPIGFLPESKLYPVVTPNEMQTGPKIILQLGNKKFRRMSDPDSAIAVPVLAYDPTTGGLKWVNLVTGPGSTQTVVYPYDGVLHTFTVPVWCTKMAFHIWGGGGSTDSTGIGGAGAYVTGFLAVTAGELFTIVTGGGAPGFLNARAFGGGGMMSPSAHQGAGGGFSGIFTGSGIITGGAADQARAVAIAGGGGAGGATNPGQNIVAGGPGGFEFGAVTATMAGSDGTGTQFAGTGGGGGGYHGGAPRGIAGWGGTSFLAAGVQAGQKLNSPDGSPAVQMSSSPFYVTGVGRPGAVIERGNSGGGPGHIVLELS